MKKLASLFLFIGIIALIQSCEKDEGKLPNIAFKVDLTHVFKDQTATQNDTLLIGITASKSEDKDVLKTFNGTVSYDGAAATTIVNESLSGSNGDNYSKDIQVITRSQAGTEKYTFTVVNRDGITNSVSLTLTVN